MKYSLRRLISLFIAATLVVMMPMAMADYDISIEDAPTINVVIPTLGTSTEDAAAVEAAVNEIMVPLTGAKVHLTFTSLANHSQVINMMLTSADELDITMVYGSPLSYIQNGQTLDLTDYIDGEQGAGIRGVVGDSFIDANRWEDGKMYYLGTVHDHSTEFCFAASSALYKGMGYEIDDEKIWTLSELHDLIKQAVDTYGCYGVVGSAGYVNWDNLGDNANIGVVENRGTTGKVVSITECQEFIDFVYTMNDWYEEGLIMPDIMTSSENALVMVMSGTGFGHFLNGPCPNGMESEDSYRVLLSLNTPWFLSNSAQTIGYIINAQTRHPDEAFRVLSEMYTNEEIKTLLSFGIEGTHYVIGDDGRAMYPDGIDQSTATYNLGFLNWFCLPNGQCDLAPYTQDSNYWQMTRDYDATAESNPLLGCVFNQYAVADEYTACANVYDQYYDYLMSGSVDPDDMLPEFAEALKDAGEDAVIAEKQRQVDAFLAR